MSQRLDAFEFHLAYQLASWHVRFRQQEMAYELGTADAC